MADTVEIWKKIAEWPYEVSNFGRVRRVTAATNTKAGSIIRLCGGDRGYMKFTMCRPGKRITTKVHRLVCEAFNGPPPPGRGWVAHRDCNPANNTPENLYWATPQENRDDTIRMGNMLVGSQTSMAKLNEAAVVAMRLAYAERKVTLSALAARYSVTKAAICAAIHRRTWKHV